MPNDKLIEICAWCPKKPEPESKPEENNPNITHGICKTCAKKLLAESDD